MGSSDRTSAIRTVLRAHDYVDDSDNANRLLMKVSIYCGMLLSETPTQNYDKPIDGVLTASPNEIFGG